MPTMVRAPEVPTLPPMIEAAELQQIAPDLFFWQAYDRKVKADLSSAAIATRKGTFLIDPIPLTDVAVDQLRQAGAVAGVIITNINHLRASDQFAERFDVPIYALRESFPDRTSARMAEIEDGAQICDSLEVIVIEGAAAGEIVLYSSKNGGALILGDALINFEPFGFAFLPRKYCANEKKMRRSLRKLLGHRSERILFAHGTPILSQATARLQELLDPPLERPA
jgi:glyoxylase-like metal-dependent hydrolase (beta-lactamase superfamily II)